MFSLLFSSRLTRCNFRKEGGTTRVERLPKGSSLFFFLMLSLSATQTHSSILSAQTQANELEFPPADAQTWIFPNGFTLIVKRDASAPVASVQAWCATGSIHEGKWLGAGLSHILEHMLFKGTEKRGANDIARQIQEKGGYVNAYTSFDRTVFWIDIPSEGVATAIDILADAMLHSTLPESEYEKEQEVIRREFAMGFDDPSRVLSKLLFETCFVEHPTRYPVIGYLDIYNRLTRADVFEYYKKRYVPNNLFLIVVGDVDPQAVHNQVLDLFGQLPRATLEPIFLPDEPRQLGRRERHEEFATDLTRLQIAWPTPGITHPDMPALQILSEILGGGRSSRLYLGVREKLGLAHEVGAYSYTPAGPGLFLLSALADPDKRASLTEALLAEIHRISNEKPSDAEVARAKRRLLAAQFQQLSTMRGQASDLGFNWLLTKNLDFSRNFLNGINNVTAEDVRRVADIHLREDSLNIVSLNPPSKVGTDQKAKPTAERAAFQKTTFPDGLRLLHLEDHRLPLVTIVAVFRSGVLFEPPSQSGISSLLANLLLKGTPTRDAERIANEIEEAGGTISADSANNTLIVTIDILENGLPLAVEVLADVLRNAHIPEDALERERGAQLAEIKAERDKPLFLARKQLVEILFGDHPYSRSPSGSAETVSAITRSQLLAFRDAHLRPSNCVLAIAGAVDKTTVEQLVAKHFADWGGAKDSALVLPPEPVFPTDKRFVQSEAPKNQAILMIGYPGVKVSDSDFLPLQLVAEASSDMGSRFFDRIREQLGLAYFVGAVQQTGLAPGSFIFYLGTDPAELDAVRATFQEEIDLLMQDGLQKDEFERARQKYLGESKISNQSARARASQAASNEILGLGYDYEDAEMERAANLTLEEVNAALVRCLKRPNVVSVIRPSEPATLNSK